MRSRIFWGLCLAVSGCIGVDYLDDPILGESIVVSTDPVVVKLGATSQATFVFNDQYGIPKEVNPSWSTLSSVVATVDGKGLVTGKKPGQTFLIVAYNSVKDTALVTVVPDENAVAKVELVSSTSVLSIGQTVALSATVKNLNDQLLSGKSILWKSSNEAILSVSTSGLVTALANGLASITATVDGVASNPIVFAIGNAGKTGTFAKSGGYEASGTCNLRYEGNKLILKFESDFKTSFALGTFIYLSNSNTSASTVKTAGLELAQITQNGAHSFDVTAINSSIKIDDYKYVVILCKPATLIFGYAELK